ncbi:hypothetical protein, partial [Bhargavaea ullalensis]|uniref:hypothetical protein n=1 Tax=Bhargavaea ullalensis TaxID=1265685 RepID=UPI003397E5F1
KVHLEFGILALAHNFLKVAGILRMPSAKHIQYKKKEAKNDLFFASFFILGTYRTASFFLCPLPDIHQNRTKGPHTSAHFFDNIELIESLNKSAAVTYIS